MAVDTAAEVFTVEEAAHYLKIGRQLAYEMARTGRLPVLRLGRRLLVSRRALERLLEEAGKKKEEAAPQPSPLGGRRGSDATLR